MNDDRTAFAQLTWCESLRDIETCLAAFGPKLYQAGIRQPTARNTLAVANEKRARRIFADFAQVLIEQSSRLYADGPFRFELQAAAYALDSTTIDLCLSLFFKWANLPPRQVRHQTPHLADAPRQLFHRHYCFHWQCS